MVLRIALTAFALFLTAACGTEKEEEKVSDKAFVVAVEDDDAHPSAAATGTTAEAEFHPDNAASLAAFKDTLWPLLKEHCSGCHGGSTSPFFAVPDAYRAHKTVIESHLVAPGATPSSRFVTRLSLNNHNCWSECPADSQKMHDAIKAWLDKAGIKDAGSSLIRVGKMPLTAIHEVTLPGGDHGSWVREAENFDGLGESFKLVDDATASNNKIIARVEVSQDTPQEERPQGEATYYFNLPPGDNYSLWFRVRDAGTGRGIFYRINGGREVRAQHDQNTQDWAWIQAFDQQPVKPPLGASFVTVSITGSEMPVDMVAVTNQETFDRSAVENTGRRQALEFDLSPTLGKKVALLMLVSPGPDATSYILDHPTLRFDEPAKVVLEKLNVLVNDEFNPQLSTFANITATAEATTELSSRGLVVQKKGDDDTITLGFGTLKLAE